jgi:hypothetical protein
LTGSPLFLGPEPFWNWCAKKKTDSGKWVESLFATSLTVPAKMSGKEWSGLSGRTVSVSGPVRRITGKGLVKGPCLVTTKPDAKTKQAKARKPPKSPMNKLEQDYQSTFLVGQPHGFEEITLALGGGARYTPDFWTLGDDDVLEFHEIKGHWREAAKVRIKVASAKYPQFRFRAFRRVEKVWHVEHFGLEDAA